MLINTQGLVVHTTRYGETSTIAKVFTRDMGMCSYIIKGVRSRGARVKQNLLQPMSHLDMTVYNNPKKDLQYVKEMHPRTHYNNTAADGIKMALLFFIDEVVYKSLKEGEPNTQLFDYLVATLVHIDTADAGTLAALPIEILIRTATHLGIAPLDNYSQREPLFNLKEGRFLSAPSIHDTSPTDNVDYFLDNASSTNFHHCLTSLHSHSPMPPLSAAQRRTTLNNLLEYYHVHLDDFRNFHSHEVLHEVLR